MGSLGGQRDNLRERVAALKHDLGKYVAWTSANLDASAWDGAVDDGLLEALRGDLLRTRTRAGVAEAAWEVWERLTADLPRPLEVPELEAVEGAVARLRDAEPALRARDAAAVGARRGDLRDAQQLIRQQLSHLHRRLAQE